MSNYIRFDWAMKRLLRDKANFAVLEGLMTTLLGEKITIQKLLESESNQESEYDKYNCVDILAEDTKGELLLFEIQNNNEYAYFQRMLFGTSKLVTEYILSLIHIFRHVDKREVCLLDGSPITIRTGSHGLDNHVAVGFFVRQVFRFVQQ